MNSSKLQPESCSLEERVGKLERNIYGNPDDIRSSPGLVNEVRMLDMEIKRTNDKLDTITELLRKVNWLIIGAIVAAVVTQVMRK